MSLGLAAVLVVACGGGGHTDNSNPADNPADILNPNQQGLGRRLSFAYYQRCVHPILLAQLRTPSPTATGQSTTSSCASAGCHADATGTGGALRLDANAASLNLSLGAVDAAAARSSSMWRNFQSAQGVTTLGNPSTSRLLNKPLLNGTLHGGGRILVPGTHAYEMRIISNWIRNPMPEGEDEFSPSAAVLFVPPDVTRGQCESL